RSRSTTGPNAARTARARTLCRFAWGKYHYNKGLDTRTEADWSYSESGRWCKIYARRYASICVFTFTGGCRGAAAGPGSILSAVSFGGSERDGAKPRSRPASTGISTRHSPESHCGSVQTRAGGFRQLHRQIHRQEDGGGRGNTRSAVERRG